jgi:hypothetical protein
LADINIFKRAMPQTYQDDREPGLVEAERGIVIEMNC